MHLPNDIYIKSFESTYKTWVRVFQTCAKFTFLYLFGKKVFNFTNKSLNNTDKLGLRMIIYNLQLMMYQYDIMREFSGWLRIHGDSLKNFIMI